MNRGSEQGRLRRLRQRLDAARRWLGPRYLELDPRTLGLYRIVLGLLLCIDCLRRWAEARLYYSNDGVLSNHYHLFRPSSDFNFSLFHAFSTIEEVHVAFALAFLSYFLFTVGYKARLFAVLSTLWVTSMDNRLVMIENGGYVVVNLMCFWAIFLPIGERFSIDSLIRSLRSTVERTPEELAAWQRPPPAMHRSLASLALFLNFGTVYIFNVVNKYGSTWRDGLTIHYVLHIDRMVTGIAVLAREHMPLWSLWAVNHAVLVVEAMIIVLIFWPRARLWSRPIAMLLVAGLHAGFGLMMRLGPFSWFMVGWSMVLLTSVHWRALAAFYRRRVGVCEVRYRPDSGLAFQLCRLAKRLDGAERLRLTPAPAQAAWIEVDGLRGRAALWALMRALPAGRWIVPVLRTASLGLADAAAGFLAARPSAVTRFFGLPPAGLTTTARPPKPPETPKTTETPASQWLARWRVRVREGAIVLLLLMAASQLINENKSIPKQLKHAQPKIVRAVLQYPRIFQGWGMFAPNPIREDGIVAIDARTLDGRHVDPLRDGAEPDLNLSDARGLGLNQVQQDYANRIRLDRNRALRKPLGDFLQRWHLLTGRPEDEIVAYDVWWLRDQNPRPGEREPRDHEKLCIASWRKPGFRPPQGQPPLGAPCRVVSAEKDDDDKAPPPGGQPPKITPPPSSR